MGITFASIYNIYLGIKEERRRKMRPEFDYGRDYAEHTGGDGGVVDVMNNCPDIPVEDYVTMKRDGINNPDARKYWEGYNSYFK